MNIYRLLNKINGKSYIGKTIQNPNDRLKEHIYQSKKSSSSNIYPIHHAIKKYGIDNFDFIIIDTATSIEELSEKETQYITKFNSLSPLGYNLMLGPNHTPNTKSKIRVKAIGRKKTKEQIEDQKKLARAKKNGIKGYNPRTKKEIFLPTLKDIVKIGGSPKYLSAMLSGKKNYKTYLGYYFIHETKSSNFKPKFSHKKPVYRINKNTGEKTLYECLEAASSKGFSKSVISSYANKKRKNNTEYEWKYLIDAGV